MQKNCILNCWKHSIISNTAFVTRLTRRVPLVEQKRPTLPEHTSSPPVFSGVRSLVLCVCFVDRCLSFFFWSLCCLSFFDLRILITPEVSSNSFYILAHSFAHCKVKLLYAYNFCWSFPEKLVARFCLLNIIWKSWLIILLTQNAHINQNYTLFNDYMSKRRALLRFLI